MVPFWDSFKCAVHKNGEVSKIDKFNYLHSLLEGAAILSIQGIRLTADNYDSAIKLLKNQFSNTHLIIATLFYKFFKLPACIGDVPTLSDVCIVVRLTIQHHAKR